MIHQGQLCDYVIRPALEGLDAWSPAAERLVWGTAAVESAGGYYLAQHPEGPALGIFQMESATHNDLRWNYFHHRPKLERKLRDLVGGTLKPDRMRSDLLYAAAFCRLHYLRRPEPLPNADDIEGMARYWKMFYNTRHGAGTVGYFLREWEQRVQPHLKT